jgi:hypothetical protein
MDLTENDTSYEWEKFRSADEVEHTREHATSANFESRGNSALLPFQKSERDIFEWTKRNEVWESSLAYLERRLYT